MWKRKECRFLKRSVKLILCLNKFVIFHCRTGGEITCRYLDTSHMEQIIIPFSFPKMPYFYQILPSIATAKPFP